MAISAQMVGDKRPLGEKIKSGAVENREKEWKEEGHSGLLLLLLILLLLLLLLNQNFNFSKKITDRRTDRQTDGLTDRPT